MDTAQRGAALTAIASGYKSQNILSPDHDVVGVAGEQAVATMFGVAMPDPIPTGRGDGGRDLPDIAGYPPDVKTARKPGHLPVVVGKLDRRTLYILCGYSDETKLAVLAVGLRGRGLRMDRQALPQKSRDPQSASG